MSHPAEPPPHSHLARSQFRAAGGHAQWDFIVFRHNQHQVERAQQLSREWGFSKFQVKKTARCEELRGCYVDGCMDGCICVGRLRWGG